MHQRDRSGSVDMTAVQTILKEISAMVTDLDGATFNVEGDNNKERMRASAERSRDLLYAAHLADMCRAELLSQYHRFKGKNPPLVDA